MPENDTSYSRFTFDERCEIKRLLDHRISMGRIVRELGTPAGPVPAKRTLPTTRCQPAEKT